jgi:hypothetical protein
MNFDLIGGIFFGLILARVLDVTLVCVFWLWQKHAQLKESPERP